MRILTWNIQATKGCDNKFDVHRIVGRIKQLGTWDVICLQEVSKNIPDLNGDDQPAIISSEFSGYEPVWGPGFSAAGANHNRCEFGNLTLVKAKLFQNSRVHSLPSPSVDVLQMPRTMVEVVVGLDGHFVSIFNSHLAFHSSAERVQQIQAITQLRDQVLSKYDSATVPDSWGPYRYVNECSTVILCGDLNEDLGTDVFDTEILAQGWFDCWSLQNSRQPRQPTCGCFDQEQWPQGPHVKDFFLVSRNTSINTLRVDVDVATDASDHQPVFMEIAL